MSVQPSIRYSIFMDRPSTHYFDVKIEVSGFSSDFRDRSHLCFIMPTWTPGSYLIREFSRNILEFQASDSASGKELFSQKISKNVWQVNAEGVSSLKVSYKVYAFEQTVDTSYLDDLHGSINGASVFMFVEGLENNPLMLEIHPFSSWKKISTSLQLAEREGHYSSLVPNYDILVDSPIEIGNQEVQSFTVSGVEHTVSLYSRAKFDSAKLVSDIKRIVESTIPIFGEIPYNRYLFLIEISADGKYGGLEHLSSTHCIAPYYRLEPAQEYRQLLSLFSHEFFHAWNVKRMRPTGLGPFDYSREAYTRSLWIAEGITSYYDDLILRRAHIYSVPEYLDALVSNLNLLMSLPSAKRESAEESSFDAWIKHYRPDENTVNVHPSYYIQGAVIGWMIDSEIRRETMGIKSLDDVMRQVYRETYLKEGRGFKDEEFEAACRKLVGDAITRTIFEGRVRGKEQADFQKFLGYAGLMLKPKSEKEVTRGYIGMNVRSETGRSVVVASILSGSPAESAGISAGDEIIAIDDLRVDIPRLGFYIANRAPETETTILLSRNGTLIERKARLERRPTFEYRIQKKDSANEEERALFHSWMLSSWEEELKYEEYIQSPQRRQIFDYL